MMRVLGCSDFGDGCCDSCHEDEAHGWGELMDIYCGDELFAMVCCRHADMARNAAANLEAQSRIANREYLVPAIPQPATRNSSKGSYE